MDDIKLALETAKPYFKENGLYKYKICNIREDYIFNKIYIERNIEESLKKVILNNKFTLLTGAGGSGKTSLIKKSINLHNENGDSICEDIDKEIVYINFESEVIHVTHHTAMNICLNNEEMVESVFKEDDLWFELLEDNIYTKLETEYLSLRYEKNYLNSFIVFLFVYKSSQESKINIFFDNLIESYTNQGYNFPKTKSGDSQRESYYNICLDFFEEQKTDDTNKILQDFRNYIQENKRKFLRHLLAFLSKKLGKNIILIFDNIDRLELLFQTKLYISTRNLSSELNTIDTNVNILVSIREENTLRLKEHIMDEGGIPLEKFEVTKNQDDLFHQTAQKIFSVSEKRLEIAKDDCDFFIEPLLKLNEYLFDCNNIYLDYNLFHLANKSIRTSLGYIYDFYEWLLIKNDFSVDDLLKQPPLALHSLFYGWVATNSSVVKEVNGLNLTEIISRMRKENYNAYGCDIHYLILTSLSNVKSLSFKEIQSNLNMITDLPSIDLKKILHGMYFLSRNDENIEEYGHIISISNDRELLSPEDIKDDSQIYIYPRGKELLKVSITFTFTNILFCQKYKIKKNKNHSYFDLSNFYSNFHAEINSQVDFLGRIIIIHLIELYRICSRMGKYPNWFEDYIKIFGNNNKLQTINIIDSNIAFFKRIKMNKHDTDMSSLIDKSISAFKNLRSMFDDELSSILSNTEKSDYLIRNFNLLHCVEQLKHPDLLTEKLDIQEYLDHT